MSDIQVTIEDAQPIHVSLGEAVNVFPGGSSDHQELENIGENTHEQIDEALAALATELEARVASSSIVDNLAGVSATVPLSANQGRVLKSLIDTINTLLSSDDTTLDELQEIVEYIKLNRADLDTLSIDSIAGLQAALDAKANSADLTAHTENTNNPHDTTKAQVGLANVDNTSDASKPVSTAMQTALINNYSGQATPSSVLSVHSDDGWATTYDEFFQIWRPLGIPFGIGIITSLIGSAGYLTAAQIVELSNNGVEILSHSVTHRSFTTLTETELHSEFSQSKATLEALTGKKVNYFIYPSYLRNETTDRIGLMYYDSLRGNSATGSPLKETYRYNEQIPAVHSSFNIDTITMKNPGAGQATRQALLSLISLGGKAVIHYHFTSDDLGVTNRATFNELKDFANQLVSIGASFTSTTRMSGQKSLTGQLPIKTYGEYVLPEKVGVAATVSSSTGYLPDYGMTLTTAAAANNTRTKANLIGIPPLSKIKISFRASVATTLTGAYGVGFCVSELKLNNGTTITSPFGTNGLGNLAFYDSINSPRVKAVRAISDAPVSYYYLTPADKRVERIGIGLGLEQVGPTTPLTISDFRIEVLESYNSVTGNNTLNGTTGRQIATGWPTTVDYTVSVTPTAAIVGQIYIIKSNWFFTVYSTNAADAGAFTWTIT